MAKTGYGVVHRFTQAEVDAGKANSISGARIEIIDANGLPTGVVYESGAAGVAPSQTATQATVTQAVSAALKKVQLTGTGSVALTYTAHNGAEVHAESGITACTMALTNFQVSGAQQTGSFYLFNYTGGNLPLTISGFNGGISEDGDLTNDIAGTGTLITIPHAKKILVVFDADGWVRATLMGVEVTQTELDAVSNAAVKLTGDQTVAGKKTFSTLPEVSADATTDNQLVRKSQHDTKAPTVHSHPSFIPLWVMNTAVVVDEIRRASTSAGAIVIGDVIISSSTRTTGSTFDATEAGNWAVTIQSPFTVSAKEVSANKRTTFQATPDDTHYPSEKLTKDSLDAKQNTLVSGTNVKTVNSNSLLGSGNLVIAAAGVGGSTNTQEKLVTTLASANWNVSKARSTTGVTGDCFVEWKNTGATLDFGYWGFDIRAAGTTDYAPYSTSVYGISGNTGNYKAAGVDGATTDFGTAKVVNDTLRLERVSNVVRAYQNGVLKYTWVTTNSGTLYFGGTFVNTSSGIHDIRMGTLSGSVATYVNIVWEIIPQITQTESTFNIVDVPIYATNAAATTGGLSVGSFYRLGGDPDYICVVH